MQSCITIVLLTCVISSSTGGDDDVNPKQHRQSFGTNLVDPYYAFNPDYMGGNMPNIPLSQNNADSGRARSCTCTCGDRSYGPPVVCLGAQTCVAYCLDMYPGQCTVVNTFGCCGESCQYLQTQSLERRFCTCNCAGQQFSHPMDTCVSTQGCLTRCLTAHADICTATTAQACCGQDCQSYSQAVANSCACRCETNTYYPSPKCSNPESCVSTCMTTYSDCTTSHTQGCCGASCTTYVPTCSCNCGRDYSTTTSIPCQNGQTCLETCLRSYSACTQENTHACCGPNCVNAVPTCSCMCGSGQSIALPTTCGSAQHCVQACLQAVPQCNVMNAQGCCGGDCSGYMPTCRCQCGASVYYSTSMCANAEQCTNACISQYGHACRSSNTIGCCNGTICTRQNRFVGVNRSPIDRLSSMLVVLSITSVPLPRVVL